MDLRFMGFDQNQNTRVFRFNDITQGEPSVGFTISADLALFLKHHIGLQEGPALCAHKLAAHLENLRPGDHVLTNEDMLAYLMARSNPKSRTAKSGTSLRRGKPGV